MVTIRSLLFCIFASSSWAFAVPHDSKRTRFLSSLSSLLASSLTTPTSTLTTPTSTLMNPLSMSSGGSSVTLPPELKVTTHNVTVFVARFINWPSHLTCLFVCLFVVLVRIIIILDIATSCLVRWCRCGWYSQGLGTVLEDFQTGYRIGMSHWLWSLPCHYRWR